MGAAERSGSAWAASDVLLQHMFVRAFTYDLYRLPSDNQCQASPASCRQLRAASCRQLRRAPPRPAGHTYAPMPWRFHN